MRILDNNIQPAIAMNMQNGQFKKSSLHDAAQIKMPCGPLPKANTSSKLFSNCKPEKMTLANCHVKVDKPPFNLGRLARYDDLVWVVTEYLILTSVNRLFIRLKGTFVITTIIQYLDRGVTLHFQDINRLRLFESDKKLMSKFYFDAIKSELVAQYNLGFQDENIAKIVHVILTFIYDMNELDFPFMFTRSGLTH